MKHTLRNFFCVNGLMLLLTGIFALGMLASCSDNDEEVSEYQDWKLRNDAYFASLRTSALDSIAAAKRLYGDDWQDHTSWRTYLSYSLDETVAHRATDSIYVQVLQKGTGSVSPLGTDSCRIFYQGKLIPSESYSDGYIFSYSGQSSKYSDIFDRNTAIPTLRKVTSWVNGFATALLYMHVGDKWRIYIPYALAYQGQETSGVPAYSTLIYDIELVAFYRPGTSIPAWT